MKHKILLPFFFLVLVFSSSCTKNNTVNELQPRLNTRSDLPGPIGPGLVQNDAVLAQNFVSSIESIPYLSLNDLYSMDHQASGYTQILASSTAILQQANILEALKTSLGITTNDDPKIIIAALLIDNIYKVPRPVLEGSAGWDILKCALTALGLPMTAMTQLVGSMTIAEIGTAIYAMGFKWFAGAVLKTGLKAASGAGLVIMAAQFTFCMIWGDAPPTIDSLQHYAPNVDIQEPQPGTPTYNYTAAEFNNYIESVKNWVLAQATEPNGVPYPATYTKADLKYFITLFNNNSGHPVHDFQNDARFQLQLTSYIDNIYFNSGAEVPLPQPH